MGGNSTQGGPVWSGMEHAYRNSTLAPVTRFPVMSYALVRGILWSGRKRGCERRDGRMKANSFGTMDGCERHNRTACTRCAALARYAYNRRTSRLKPTGDAARHRLVAARINLRREER